MTYLDWNDPQYTISFYLTIGIIITKFALAGYLVTLVRKRNKERGKFQIDFIFSFFIFLIFLGLSRCFYFYYDFFLTHFDSDLLWIKPNIYYWKVATFLGVIPGALVLYVIDKKVWNFKFKGILAYILFVSGMIQFFYPVNSAKDFNFISQVGLIATLLAAIIPLTFIYLAYKSSGDIRRNSIIITISILIYAVAGMLMSEPILIAFENIVGTNGRIFVIVLVPIMKIIGLSGLTYGISKFQI